MIDTSILVRAMLNPTGFFGRIFRLARAGGFTPVISWPILDEMVAVLRRPRLRGRYGINDAIVANVIDLLIQRGILVTPSTRVQVCRDPKDNMVLEAALAGEADVIVSGDEDLLVLSPFEGIPIVTPAAFLRMLRAEDRG